MLFKKIVFFRIILQKKKSRYNWNAHWNLEVNLKKIQKKKVTQGCVKLTVLAKRYKKKSSPVIKFVTHTIFFYRFKIFTVVGINTEKYVNCGAV
jgi:hypothetical protein